MEKTFQYQQFNIRYSDTGKGLPVVLLHGFGEDSRIWKHQAAFLEPVCRLIIPDLPASGSSLPTSTDVEYKITHGIPSSIDRMADAIAALVAHESLELIVLLGHSMGGYITLAFAEKYPEKLLAFGLVHSTAFADTEEKKANRHKGIEAVRKNGGYAFLQTAIPGLFSQSFKEKQPGLIAEQIGQFDPSITNKTVVDAAVIAYYEGMIARPDRTSVLESSKVPVLFIIGTEDKAVPMEDTLKQVSLPVISYVHILENTGHMSMLESTEVLNKHLLNFINDLKQTINIQ